MKFFKKFLPFKSFYSNPPREERSEEKKAVKLNVKTNKIFKEEDKDIVSEKIFSTTNSNSEKEIEICSIRNIESSKLIANFHRRKRFLSDELSHKQILNIKSPSQLNKELEIRINGLKERKENRNHQSHFERNKIAYLILIVLIVIIGILILIYK